MARIITLTCPSCGAKARISDDAARMHCDHCGNEHLLQINLTPVAAAPPAPIRPRVGQPGSIRIEQDETSWRIVKRWFSAGSILLSFFAFTWIAFLAYWYSMALTSGSLIMLLFPVAHLGVGLYLAYATLANFVNRTTIEIYQNNLVVRHDPLPWPGEKTIPVGEIKQLYCKETVKRKKHSERLVYHLYAVRQDNVQVKLLGNLRSPEVVLFLEQQLEQWLRIPDQPVIGELRR